MGRLTAQADVDLDGSRFTADARGMWAFEQHVWMADPNNSSSVRAVPLPSRGSPPQPHQASARMPAAMPAGRASPLVLANLVATEQIEARVQSPKTRTSANAHRQSKDG